MRLRRFFCAMSMLVCAWPAQAYAAPVAARTIEFVTPGYKVGDIVEVEWHGRWYQAKILEVRSDGYMIGYVGWTADWNEVVSAARIRNTSPSRPASGIGAPVASNPAPAWTGGRKLTGEWRFAAILQTTGKDYELGNRSSTLNLDANGTFVRNLSTLSTSALMTGRWTLKGDKLTLLGENREPMVYSAVLSADGATLLLKSDGGGGYRLVRAVDR